MVDRRIQHLRFDRCRGRIFEFWILAKILKMVARKIQYSKPDRRHGRVLKFEFWSKF